MLKKKCPRCKGTGTGILLNTICGYCAGKGFVELDVNNFKKNQVRL